MKRIAKVTHASSSEIEIELEYSQSGLGETRLPHEASLDRKLRKVSEYLVDFLLCQERGKEVYDPNYKFPVLPSCIYSRSFLLRTGRECSCLPTECEKAYQDLIDITFAYTKAVFEYGCAQADRVQIYGFEDSLCMLNPLLMAMSVMIVPEDYAKRCFKGKNFEVILDKDLPNSVELIITRKCVLEI